MTHWIKMRKDLKGDPAVLLLSATLGLSRREVVGVLHDFWSWADTNLADGTAPGLTPEHLDRLVEVPGFCAALAKVGWLTLSSEGIVIPSFDRHLGNGAKRRAINAVRAATHRSRRRTPKISPPTAPNHVLVDEIARHFSFGYAKAGRVVNEVGVNPDDWQAWLTYEREHGTALTALNIQRFRRPEEVPARLAGSHDVSAENRVSRRSSFAEPGKFNGIE